MVRFGIRSSAPPNYSYPFKVTIMTCLRNGSYDSRTLIQLTHILLTNRSLFTPFPLPPLGFSVHISFTFSSTMLQCRSNALTLASNLRLFRHDIKTWVCDRVAVWRMDNGPDVSSCSSKTEISYSLSHSREC